VAKRMKTVTVQLTNSTLSNNFARQNGGAIYNNMPGTMTVNGCTFSANIANWGSNDPIDNDIYNYASLASSLTISNSVFSNNTSLPSRPTIVPWTDGGGNTFK
jgi:hypothetical protein